MSHVYKSTSVVDEYIKMKCSFIFTLVSARFVPYTEVNICPDEATELHAIFELHDELEVIRGRGHLKGGDVKVDFNLEQSTINANGTIEFENVYNQRLMCTWDNIESEVFGSHLMSKMEKFFAEERNIEDFLTSYTPTTLAAVLNDRVPDYFGFQCDSFLGPELKVFD